MGTDGKMVQFAAGSRAAGGYLAAPDGEAVHPGLIVIQEWWGLNEHIKEITRRFAAEGYAALAPDLYDGVVTKDSTQAGKLMQSLDQAKAIETIDGAITFLQDLKQVDPARIGITGFCMGGTYALRMACHSPYIKASAPFYGDVPEDSVLAKLSAPVLFFGGDQDQWINSDKTDRLKHTLKKFNKEGEVKVYKGVGHAFFNDTRPEAYNKSAAEDAWKRTLAFFADKLRAWPDVTSTDR